MMSYRDDVLSEFAEASEGLPLGATVQRASDTVSRALAEIDASIQALKQEQRARVLRAQADAARVRAERDLAERKAKALRDRIEARRLAFEGKAAR